MNELCIRCNKPTPYDQSTPITLRRYYIEGSGQLCEKCYFTLYPVAGPLGIPLGGGLDEKAGTGKEERNRPLVPEKNDDYSKIPIDLGSVQQ